MPVFVPGDLDPQTHPSEEPNTSSMWMWHKSVQRFRRYFIHKQKTQTDGAKTEPYAVYCSSLRAVKSAVFLHIYANNNHKTDIYYVCQWQPLVHQRPANNHWRFKYFTSQMPFLTPFCTRRNKNFKAQIILKIKWFLAAYLKIIFTIWSTIQPDLNTQTHNTHLYHVQSSIQHLLSRQTWVRQSSPWLLLPHLFQKPLRCVFWKFMTIF